MTARAPRKLATAVRSSLAQLDLPRSDLAARALAEAYARRIDDVAALAGHAEQLLDDAAVQGERDLYERVRALQAKLDEQTTLVLLGQRLEAILGALGATPVARAKTTGAAAPGAPAPSRMAAFRAGITGVAS